MLLQLGLKTLSLSVLGGLVYLLTRFLPCDRERPRFDDPRRAAVWGLVAVLIGWILVAGLFLAFTQGEPSAAPEPEAPAVLFGPGRAISQALVALLAFGPIVLFLKLQHQDWPSAGVTRRNLRCALIVGLVLGFVATAAVLFFTDRSPGEILAGLGASHFWAFATFLSVGFGEEFAFRGYLQTRLEAWLGWWQGWAVASVLMALAHVVQRITFVGLAPGEALLDSLTLVPTSLFMGWVMLRTRNVVAPGLAHTFADWVGTLL